MKNNLNPLFEMIVPVAQTIQTAKPLNTVLKTGAVKKTLGAVRPKKFGVIKPTTMNITKNVSIPERFAKPLIKKPVIPTPVTAAVKPTIPKNANPAVTTVTPSSPAVKPTIPKNANPAVTTATPSSPAVKPKYTTQQRLAYLKKLEKSGTPLTPKQQAQMKTFTDQLRAEKAKLRPNTITNTSTKSGVAATGGNARPNTGLGAQEFNKKKLADFEKQQFQQRAARDHEARTQLAQKLRMKKQAGEQMKQKMSSAYQTGKRWGRNALITAGAGVAGTGYYLATDK